MIRENPYLWGMRKSLLIQRYSTLFWSLVLLLVLISFAVENQAFGVFAQILYTLVAVSGVYVASTERKHIIISVCLAIPWLVAAWSGYADSYVPTGWHIILDACLGSLFLGYTIFLVLQHLLSAQKVTTDLLFGGGSVYLMLGILWAFFYAILQQVEPSTFVAPEEVVAYSFDTILYYSFTTLTTLGYGDILPVSPFARTLAILEAITGVLYTAILVARLMGIYLAGFLGKSRED
jgi:hypothetical protein